MQELANNVDNDEEVWLKIMLLMCVLKNKILKKVLNRFILYIINYPYMDLDV